MRWVGDVLVWIFFLRDNVTLMIKREILLSKMTMTVICERMPAFLSPRFLGFSRMEKLSLAVELSLSEAERRALSL